MTPDDFQTYYAGTVIKTKNGEVLWLVQAHGSGEATVITIPKDFKPWSTAEMDSWPKTRIPIDAVLELVKDAASPVYGYHNGLGDSVFYLSMTPKRQNKKAMTSERISLSVPNPKETVDAFKHSTGRNISSIEQVYLRDFPTDVLWASFHPEYESLENAVIRLKTGNKLGLALSEDLSLVTRSNVRFPVLFYKERAIGIIKERTVKLFEEFQEYAEAIKRSKNSINSYRIETEKGTL